MSNARCRIYLDYISSSSSGKALARRVRVATVGIARDGTMPVLTRATGVEAFAGAVVTGGEGLQLEARTR